MVTGGKKKKKGNENQKNPKKTNPKQNQKKTPHAKAKKFKVVEESLKIICIIMMHSFYIKLLFFPNPGPIKIISVYM